MKGNLQLKPLTGGTDGAEGGELQLSAADDGKKYSNLTLDNYKGYFRLFGLKSEDGTTVVGESAMIQIHPFNKTMTIDSNYKINNKTTIDKLGYLSNVTSDIQTQLNAKAVKTSNSFTGAQKVSMAFAPANNNYTAAHFSAEASNASTTSNRASYGFHNSGVVAGILYLDNDGNLKYINNSGTISKIMRSSHFSLSGTTLTITL